MGRGGGWGGGGGCFLWGWGGVGKIMLEFGLVILKCLQDIQVEMLGDRCENGVR